MTRAPRVAVLPDAEAVARHAADAIAARIDDARRDGREPPLRGSEDAYEHVWTVLGASRGEPGILGEGIRHALMRDPTYKPALAAARRMLA